MDFYKKIINKLKKLRRKTKRERNNLISIDMKFAIRRINELKQLDLSEE